MIGGRQGISQVSPLLALPLSIFLAELRQLQCRKLFGRLGPFDLTFIDAGQYNERWRQVHNLPPEVIDAFNDLNGNILVPIGWGMFTLALHDWFEPPVEISSRALEIGAIAVIPRFGEWVDIKQKLPDEKWWEPIIE